MQEHQMLQDPLFLQELLHKGLITIINLLEGAKKAQQEQVESF